MKYLLELALSSFYLHETTTDDFPILCLSIAPPRGTSPAPWAPYRPDLMLSTISGHIMEFLSHIIQLAKIKILGETTLGSIWETRVAICVVVA